MDLLELPSPESLDTLLPGPAIVARPPVPLGDAVTIRLHEPRVVTVPPVAVATPVVNAPVVLEPPVMKSPLVVDEPLVMGWSNGSGSRRAPNADLSRRLRLARRLAADLALLALIAVLAFALWPARLGGATSYVIIHGESMEPKFQSGDLAVVRKADRYRVGDIVAYGVPKDDAAAGNLVIHRIVGTSKRGFITQGDNRATSDSWFPTKHDIVGRFVVYIPTPGERFWALLPWGFCALVGVGVTWLFWPSRARADEDEDEDESSTDTEAEVSDNRSDNRSDTVSVPA